MSAGELLVVSDGWRRAPRSCTTDLDRQGGHGFLRLRTDASKLPTRHLPRERAYRSNVEVTQMRLSIGRWRLAANAGFVLAVLALAGFGLYQVAGRHWQVQPTFRVRAEFDTIAGLEAGHRVRLQGIDAGVVERVVPPVEPGRPVELILRIDERLRPLVRTDAVARIVSEGLVGAKVVELTPGRPDAPPAADLDRIGSERPIEVADLLKKAAGSLARLDTLARSAEQGLGEVNAIAGSIRRGEGSLGKFVRDETLYRDLLALSRRGDRTLTALEENLDALKQTWPLSRYFDRRAYLDRERVLFQPGSQRNSRGLPRRGALRARPIRPDRRRPHPARRGRPMVQAGHPAQLGGRHRRVHRR